MSVMFLLFFISESSQVEIYQWKDEKGNIHMTDDESAIPEKYRDQAQKRHFQEESKTEGKKSDVKSQSKKEKKKDTPQKESVNLNKIESDVTDTFKTILSLWKNQKFSDLYECGDRKSRMSVNKEDFERRMRKKELELAASWETVKDIKVDIKSPSLVYTTAQIGYRSKKGGDTQFRTETYQMTFENGSWKINLQKILNARI
jgi:hypothetical protein